MQTMVQSARQTAMINEHVLSAITDKRKHSPTQVYTQFTLVYADYQPIYNSILLLV
jgi:hypothetical protein